MIQTTSFQSWLQQPEILTLDALRRVQDELKRLAGTLVGQIDVPLITAAGRVLAQSQPQGDNGGTQYQPLPPRGTRLEARHLPLFSQVDMGTVSVFPKARIGVLAMADEAGNPRRSDAISAAAWAAAAIESMGAQCFEAICRGSNPDRFTGLLDMFMDKCELVVIIGLLGSEHRNAIRALQARRKLDQGVETMSLRPIGTMQLTRLGTTLVLGISADLESCVSLFTTLITPLIRRVQGRNDIVPEVRAAAFDAHHHADMRHWTPFLVTEESPASSRVSLIPCERGDATRNLAVADGLAWHAREFDTFLQPTVAYFPFNTWTR